MKPVKLSLKTYLFILIYILSSLSFILNYLFFNIYAVSFFSMLNLLFFSGALLLGYFSYLVKESSPRVSFILKVFFLLAFTTLSVNFFTIAIQMTPFPLHDNILHKMDLALGFNLPALVDWVFKHSYLKDILIFAYDSISIQLLFIPIIFAFLQARKSIDIYFTALLLATIIAYLIYYFFPK